MSVLDRFENGREIPSLEVFYSLARAEGVPVASFFYGHKDSKLTPWLTQRLSLEQLAGELPLSASAKKDSLLNPHVLLAVTKRLLSRVTKDKPCLSDENLNPPIQPPCRQAEASEDSSEDERDSERE